MGVLPAGAGLLRHDAVAPAAGLAARPACGSACTGRSCSAWRTPGRIDWSRASADASRVAGKRGGAGTGPNPTDRGKPGAHHHLVADRRGAPLAAFSTAANVNEGTVLARLVDAIPPLKQPHGRPGRPRRRPAKLHADKAYASRGEPRGCCAAAASPRASPARASSRSERLGRYRWVVERDFAWLHRNRRLLVRYERDAALHEAFLAPRLRPHLLATAHPRHVITVRRS